MKKQETMKLSSNKLEIPKAIFENIFFKEGGTKEEKFVDVLAGGVQYGLDPDKPVTEGNAEVEEGEWILDSQGLRVVKGDKHKDGGEDVVLEDGAKVLSNYLEAPKRLINSLNKTYETKIKDKSTYAEALKAVYNKIGLSKLLDEQKELIEKVKYQQENTEDENTQMANIELLSKKIKEVEDKKIPLESKASEVFIELFEKQEDSKPNKEVETNEEGQIYAQQGAQVPTTPSWQVLNPYAQPQYGYQNFQPLGVTGVAVDKTLATPETRRIFPNLSSQYFTDGEIKPRDVLAFQSEGVNNYYASVVDSAQKLYGADSDKYKQIQTFINDNKFVDDNKNVRYTDNKYGDFTSTRPNVAFELLPKEEYDKVKKEGINTIGQLREKHPELYKQYVPEGIGAPDDVWLGPLEETELPGVEIEVGKKAEDINSSSKEAEKKKIVQDRVGVFNAPNQTPMVPDPMEAHLKVSRRYERADYTAISPEAQLQETARNQVRAEQNLDLLPSTMKAGVLANMGATSSEIANKAIAQVQQVNNQAYQNVQNYNRQVQMQEENASAQDALNFENRQLLAKARTDTDYNNWFNAVQQNQVRQFRDINNLNLMNQMYSDFQLTDRGVESYGSTPDVMNRLRQQQMNTTPEDMLKLLEQQYGKEYVQKLKSAK